MKGEHCSRGTVLPRPEVKGAEPTGFVMPPNKIQEDATVLENLNYRNDYYQITFAAPGISSRVEPGQFVGLLLPDSPELLLRGAFSVYDADPDPGTF